MSGFHYLLGVYILISFGPKLKTAAFLNFI